MVCRMLIRAAPCGFRCLTLRPGSRGLNLRAGQGRLPSQTGSPARLPVHSAFDFTETLNASGPLPNAAVTIPSSRSDIAMGAVLDAAAWSTTQRNFDTGAITCQAIVTSGSTLAACRGVNATENGALYFQGDGRLRFRTGAYNLYRTATAMLVLGPGGAFNYASIQTRQDDDTLRNRVQGTRVGGVIQMSEALATQDTLGIKLYARTDLQHVDDPGVLAWTAAVLATSSAAPAVRVASVGFTDPAVGVWPLAMWAELGDRFTIGLYTPGYSVRMDQAVKIERVTLDWRPSPVPTTVSFGCVPP